MKVDITGNGLLCAVCCNTSEHLFEMFINENLPTYLAETWGGLSPIHVVSLFHNDSLLEKLIQSLKRSTFPLER